MRSRSNLAGLVSATKRALQDQAPVFCLMQQLARGLLSLLSCCWCSSLFLHGFLHKPYQEHTHLTWQVIN